ncbi:MAG: hypothetical protein ABIM44_08500 [candidate division WOR-3 bacterium]
MSARYVHSQLVKDAILAIYGIGKAEDRGAPIKIIEYPEVRDP